MNRRSIFVCISLLNVLVVSAVRGEDAPVTISENDRTYTLDNGIVKVMVAKESGDLVSLKYKGMEMLATFEDADGLPDLNRDPPGENLAGLNRGMTDHQYGFWSHDAMGARATQADNPTIKKITIDPKTNGGQRGEVSIKGVSNGRAMGTGPGAQRTGNFIADVEIRYTLERGQSGVYTSCTFDHPACVRGHDHYRGPLLLQAGRYVRLAEHRRRSIPQQSVSLYRCARGTNISTPPTSSTTRHLAGRAPRKRSASFSSIRRWNT